MRAFSRYLPSAIWLGALLLLYFMDTAGPSLCFFRFIGWEYCWGCGLGRSVHHLLHGDLSGAWQHHWLGLPTAIAMVYLIVQPIISTQATTNYGSKNVNDAARAAAGRTGHHPRAYTGNE